MEELEIKANPYAPHSHSPESIYYNIVSVEMKDGLVNLHIRSEWYEESAGAKLTKDEALELANWIIKNVK